MTTVVVASSIALGAAAASAMPAVNGAAVSQSATTPNVEHVWCGYYGCHRYYRHYYRYGYYHPYRYYRPYYYGPHVGVGLGGVGVGIY